MKHGYLITANNNFIVIIVIKAIIFMQHCFAVYIVCNIEEKYIRNTQKGEARKW